MKGQTINVDFTVGMGLFLISALSGVLIMTESSTVSSSTDGIQSKMFDVRTGIENDIYVEGGKSSLVIRTPQEIESVPVDRGYVFPENAYPGSGAMDIPSEVVIEEDRVVTVADLENVTHTLTYFDHNNSNLTYSNDITAGSDISNSKITVSPGGNGLDSLKVDGNEVLKNGADLDSTDHTVEEHEIHAETLGGDLKVYNGSSEIIIETDSTFELRNFTEIYWHGTGTESLGPGDMYSGETDGFALSSVDGAAEDFGIAFMGDLDAEVSKQSGTVSAEVNASRIRVRLFNSSIAAGRKRVEADADGQIFFGPSEKIEGVTYGSLEELGSMTEEEFEEKLGIGNFGYNITLGPQNTVFITDTELAVSSQKDWNTGSFEGASSDRNDNSGDLGIGYRNGTPEDRLVGYWKMDKKNIVENPGFENDEVGEASPTSWSYPASDGWNVTDNYTAPESDGEKSFGGRWQDQPGTWPDAYVYTNQTVKGGEEYVFRTWIRLQDYSNANWNGPKTDQQYIYEDDARPHIYFYDDAGSLLKEEETRWIGDAYNRNVDYIEKSGDWFKILKNYTAPENAAKARLQIDGGDNNDDYGDPETSHGGNAGIWVDDTSLTRKKVKDHSGKGNDGSTHNGISADGGIFGTNSFKFNGINDSAPHVKVAPESSDDLNFNNESSFTFSAWIKPVNGGTEDDTYFVGRGHTAHSYGLFYDPTNVIGSRVRDGEGNSETIAESLTAHEWHHAVMTYKSDNLSLYIDGRLSGSLDPEVNNFSTSRDQLIGGDGRPSGTNSGFTGFQEKVDEVRIYNRSLSEDEIRQLYFHGGDGVFEGRYNSSRIDNGESRDWHNLEINATVPGDSSLTATFQALGRFGTVFDSQTFEVQKGKRNYSLSVDDTEDGRLVFEGSSTDVTESWEVNEFRVYSSEGRKNTVTRGEPIPVNQNVVVSDLGTVLIDREGNTSMMDSRVAVWR